MSLLSLVILASTFSGPTVRKCLVSLEFGHRTWYLTRAPCPCMPCAGPRVPWRYAVLSNMVLMFGAPYASATSAQPLVSHCLQLLSSDMLLLRQVGGAGLWLMLTATAQQAQGGSSSSSRVGVGRQQAVPAKALASPAVLQELKQVRETVKLVHLIWFCAVLWLCCAVLRLNLAPCVEVAHRLSCPRLCPLLIVRHKRP